MQTSNKPNHVKIGVTANFIATKFVLKTDNILFQKLWLHSRHFYSSSTVKLDFELHISPLVNFRKHILAISVVNQTDLIFFHLTPHLRICIFNLSLKSVKRQMAGIIWNGEN